MSRELISGALEDAVKPSRYHSKCSSFFGSGTGRIESLPESLDRSCCDSKIHITFMKGFLVKNCNLRCA